MKTISMAIERKTQTEQNKLSTRGSCKSQFENRNGDE